MNGISIASEYYNNIQIVSMIIAIYLERADTCQRNGGNKHVSNSSSIRIFHAHS